MFNKFVLKVTQCKNIRTKLVADICIQSQENRQAIDFLEKKSARKHQKFWL